MTRFVLTFNDLGDPLPEEVSVVRGRLDGAAIEQVTPGVLSISGAEHEVRAALADLPKWQLREEARFASPAPHRTRLKRAGA